LNNLTEYSTELFRLSALIDSGITALRDAANEAAHAEHDYRKAKAIAWTQAPQGTVPVREAWVESETADQRLRLDLAEGQKQAALEAVRSRRQQLSGIQSLLAAHKEEAAFTRTAG